MISVKSQSIYGVSTPSTQYCEIHSRNCKFLNCWKSKFWLITSVQISVNNLFPVQVEYLHSLNVSITEAIVKMSHVRFNGYIYFPAATTSSVLHNTPWMEHTDSFYFISHTYKIVKKMIQDSVLYISGILKFNFCLISRRGITALSTILDLLW